MLHHDRRCAALVCLVALAATGAGAQADAPSRTPGTEGMVPVPAGTFIMGDRFESDMVIGDAPGGAPPHTHFLPHEVRLEAFWIDRYPWPNIEGEPPMTDLSWYEAQARCKALGKRLCTEAEWEKACKGPRGLRYGYGDRFEPDWCHTDIVGSEELAAAGEHPRCASGYGVVDMLGNVNEWVSDLRRSNDNHGLPWPTGSHRGYPILRGGDLGMAGRMLTCSFRNHSHNMEYTGGDDGFRCCRSAARDSTPEQPEATR